MEKVKEGEGGREREREREGGGEKETEREKQSKRGARELAALCYCAAAALSCAPLAVRLAKKEVLMTTQTITTSITTYL